MSSAPLSRKWLKVRRQRCGELISEGLRSDLAYRLADEEARARRDVAKIVGVENARWALLTWKFEGDRMSFIVSGPAHALSAKHKAKLQSAG